MRTFPLKPIRNIKPAFAAHIQQHDIENDYQQASDNVDLLQDRKRNGPPRKYNMTRPHGGPIFPTIIEALDMWSEWYADYPFDGSRGNLLLDLALADAFRMLILLNDNKARMRWIERQMPIDHMGLPPYQVALARWWMALYDFQQGDKTNG
jgi:hypothetical protein